MEVSMFGKKKESIPTYNKEDAYQLIRAAFADMEDVSDGAFLSAYISGLSDMAYSLGAITMNERDDYKERAHKKEQEIKAKGQPIYKKKGVYEYNGYHILKDFAREPSTNACWCVRKMGAEDLLAKDLTFKDAVKVIDKAN